MLFLMLAPARPTRIMESCFVITTTVTLNTPGGMCGCATGFRRFGRHCGRILNASGTTRPDVDYREELAVKILLPPSEGKTAPAAGPKLDLGSLVFPSLTSAREQVIEALEALGPEAPRILKLGARSAEDAKSNLRLWTSPCAAAVDVYTGVLYEALDATSLSGTQNKKLDEMTLIASALFGFVRPSDRIPNHRLAIDVNLPPLGPMATWWRQHLELEEQPVFDARSGSYRRACPAPNSIELNVVRGSERKAVTHMAKKWRGLAARHLIQDDRVSADTNLTGIIESLQRMADQIGARLEVSDRKAVLVIPESV